MLQYLHDRAGLGVLLRTLQIEKASHILCFQIQWLDQQIMTIKPNGFLEGMCGIFQGHWLGSAFCYRPNDRFCAWFFSVCMVK